MGKENRFTGLSKPDALRLHADTYNKLYAELDEVHAKKESGRDIVKKMEKLNKEFKEHFNL